jgi:phosphoenolpyruvate carboxylase
LSEQSKPQVSAEELREIVKTVAELKKMLRMRLILLRKMNAKMIRLEKEVERLRRELAVQKAIAKHSAVRAGRHALTTRPANVYKAEEIRKKLEELRKKLREKKLAKTTAPRPETTTTPEPSGEDNDFREFIKKILSGKAVVSEMPAKFKVLPEVKSVEGGDGK